MHQLVEAADGVPESLGGFRTGQILDEIGPQGFVLPVVGVLGGEENVGQFH